VLPLRTNFSHTGKLAVAPARKVLGAPAVGRVMNSMPPSGLTSRITSAAPDDLAVAPHWLPDVVERIDGPPDVGAGAGTLKTPVDDTDASPATPTVAMSAAVHGQGNPTTAIASPEPSCLRAGSQPSSAFVTPLTERRTAAV
jgi:hypothetical protein